MKTVVVKTLAMKRDAMKRATMLIAMVGVAALAGCKEDEAKAENPPVRPVLSVLAQPALDRSARFAGTIQPQFQTDRGFRLLGRITARNVNVGDIVTTGQVLAQLDPLVQDFAVRTSQADLAKAQSQASNATGAQSRARALLDRKVLSQADFDTAEQTQEAATASVQQAEANLAKAREQLSYTTLRADLDGVVTSTDAEVGQTVSPGKKVMTLARLDIREAVVDLPEAVTKSLAVGDVFDVTLQADENMRTTGKVREIAPQADDVTRTRRVKITLDKITDVFRLGATITAKPVIAPDQSILEIPASALVKSGDAYRVWLVDAATKTVRSAPVTVAEQSGGGARISGGIQAGARVVVAGVNSLSDGQSIRIDENPAQ